MKTQQRISFYTLGCRLNQAETSSLRQSFIKSGFQVVDFSEPADTVVINTCTVTAGGDSDTRRLVHRVRRKNPDSRIALIGCQAESARENLLSMPGVQWVVGNARKMELAGIIKEECDESAPFTITPVIERKPFTIEEPAIDPGHTRANLKVQDGCDFFCTFCVIPFTRGRARSRVFADVLREAGMLLQGGYREIVLTGINLGTYFDSGSDITDLVKAILEMPLLERIRISSIEPTTIPDDLVRLTEIDSRCCRHWHIPLQSGSDKVLQWMDRRYTMRDYEKCVQNVLRPSSDICLGTDVIVGFPGETDADFSETYDYFINSPHAYIHVFPYSERERTRSMGLERKVAGEVIADRSYQLRQLSDRKRRVFMEQFLGRSVTVLAEQVKGGYWTGLTDNYIRVKFCGPDTIKNTMQTVFLTNIKGQGMEGQLL